jgi:polyhydroxyalkanoate synthesis regulator phasin
MTDQSTFSPVDPIRAWKDLQQSWTTAVKEMTERATQLAKSPVTPDGLKSFTDAWVDTQRKLVEQGMMMNKLFPSEDLAERFQGAAKMYLESYRMWADTLGAAQNGGAPVVMHDALLTMWKQTYRSFFEPIMGIPGMASFPGGLDISRMMQLPVQGGEALSEMQKSWMEMLDRATRTSIESFQSGGSEVMREFYASWAKGYEMTVGKVIRVPPIGPAREGIEIYQKSLDSYLKLCGAAFDFYLRTTKPSLDAFVTVSNKAHDMLKGEVTPESFQKLYGVTIAEFEKRLKELFTADEFVQAMRTTLDASMSFQSDYQSFLEANLKGTPIITRSEMDEVQEELYALKKQLRELTKTLAELRDK